MGDIKDRALRPIKLLPTFIEIDKAKYRVGQAIVDPVTGEAYRTVGDKFKLVTNLMLVEFLAEHQDIRNKTYYVNDLGDTTYINGIFPELYAVNKYNEVIYLGYTIANSYSLRFPPKILFNFYVDNHKQFIKTNFELMKLTRARDFDGIFMSGMLNEGREHIQSYLKETVTNEVVNKALHNLAKNVPARLRTTVWETLNLEPYSKYDKNSVHFIFMVLNGVCSKWGKTSYEVADAYSRKIFDQINIGAVI